MAKKKKVIEKNTNVSLTNHNIGYQGQVKVTTMHGKTPVSTKVYHNNGLPNLFKFIGLALAGAYSDKQRPGFIKLFYCGHSKPSEFNWDSETSWNVSGAASGLIPIDATPVLTQVVNSNISGSATDSQYHSEVIYHFRIPQSYIINNSIRFAALYSENNISVKQACAYHLFTKENEDEWDTLDIPGGVTDYSLVVEWTLSIMNK